jgi:hypothetical protein
MSQIKITAFECGSSSISSIVRAIEGQSIATSELQNRELKLRIIVCPWNRWKVEHVEHVECGCYQPLDLFKNSSSAKLNYPDFQPP